MTSKGRVTVPAEIRKKIGLVPGTLVEFELREDGVLLRKSIEDVHPVDRVYGLLRLDRSTDELMDEMRGPRPSSGV